MAKYERMKKKRKKKKEKRQREEKPYALLREKINRTIIVVKGVGIIVRANGRIRDGSRSGWVKSKKSASKTLIGNSDERAYGVSSSASTMEAGRGPLLAKSSTKASRS